MPHSAFRRPSHGLPLRQLVAAARRALARYLADLIAFWNRQPFDRFWPPHP